MNFKVLSILFLMLVSIGISCTKSIHTYTIGDSTMSNKKPETLPETGWCQVIDEYFDETVTVSNHAQNGRSSKSFIGEGRWQTVLDSLKKGDYVFIQFGHNDQKIKSPDRYTEPFGEYTDNLKKYIAESRSKGAIPILFTSIVRRKFDENEKLIDTHGDYPAAMRKVALETNVPLIDLQALTEELVNSMGDEPSKKMYLWTEPNEKYPDGRKDDTHLSVEGANKIAQLVTNELKKLKLPISKRVK